MKCQPPPARWRGFLPRPWTRERAGVEAGLAIVALFLSLVLADCGRRSPPEAPPGEPDTYPRSYPSE